MNEYQKAIYEAEHRAYSLALDQLDPRDRRRVETAITIAQTRLKWIGDKGATELVAKLGKWLAEHKTTR